MQTISAGRLFQYLREHPGCMLIDLRPGEDYRRSHVKGAISIPRESLWEMEMSGRLPGRRQLIFYCEYGGSAMSAARDLAEAGYDTVAVVGTYREIARLTETAAGYTLD